MYQRQAASIKLKAKRLNTALKTKATVGLNKNFLLTFYNHMQPSSKQSLENSPSKLQPSGAPQLCTLVEVTSWNSWELISK